MALVFSNFGTATIASAPSGTGGLSFSVTAGQGARFPSLGLGDYFYGIFKDSSGNREIVKIEARSTDAMTIAASGRGLDGTTARTWAAGDYFVAGLTNAALQEVFNTNLTAIAGLTSAADKLPYFTGSGAAALATFTQAARDLLDDADAATMRATLAAAALASPTFTGTPSGPTAAVNTNTTQLATTAFVLAQAGAATPLKDAASAVVGTATKFAREDHVHPATALAVGQTWQDLTASRAVSTIYTNSTGRPILINVTGGLSGAGAIIEVSIDGVVMGKSAAAYTNAAFVSVNGVVIPAGSTYSIAPNSGVLTIANWYELR